MTLIATFLGAGLAFWAAQYQADGQQREDTAAMLGFMRADCAEALTDLKNVKITEGPEMLTASATLLTLATNSTFVGAIPQDKREALVRSIYAFNRAGNNYLISANTLDTYLKLHANEYERLDTGQQVTFIPGLPPRSAEEGTIRLEAWAQGEQRHKAELTAKRQALRNDMNTKLGLVQTRQSELCNALDAAS